MRIIQSGGLHSANALVQVLPGFPRVLKKAEIHLFLFFRPRKVLNYYLCSEKVDEILECGPEKVNR